MNYKIAICDDSDADRQYVFDMVKAWAEASGHTVQVDSFPSAESFLFRYEEKMTMIFSYWILKWAGWTA